MSRVKYGIIVGTTVLLLIAAIPAYILWEVFVEHVSDPGESSSAADVTELTAVPPPPGATEIRVAHLEFGQARSTFVRFKAPVDVCRKYAELVMPKTPMAALTDDQMYSDTMIIYMNATRLTDLRWFDLPYSSTFWSAAGKPVFAKPDYQQIKAAPAIVGADENWEQKGYLVTSVRVDTDRGVFYFLQSN